MKYLRIFVAAVLVAVASGAPVPLMASGVRSDIHLVPLETADDAPVLSARAGPANDTMDGAVDLGSTLPASQSFTFAGATTGQVEAFPQAAGTVWFKLKATATGLLSATIAPTTKTDRLVLGLGFWNDFYDIGLQPFAEATAARPVKVTISVVKGRTYYLTAALLAPTTRPGDRLRKVKLTVRQPASGVAHTPNNFRVEAIRRDAELDSFNNGIPFQVVGWLRGGQAGEMSAKVTYARGAKGFLTITGAERRLVDAGLPFRVDAAIPTVPASLRTTGVSSVNLVTTDHSFGNTLPPNLLRVYTDTGGASATILAYVPRTPPSIRPGQTGQVDVVVGVPAVGEPGAAPVPTTATACQPMSHRPITWRWYDKAGKTPLAAANKPISIAVGRWARLKIAVPTSASRPEPTGLLNPGIAIDCSNTQIVGPTTLDDATFSVSTAAPPPVSIEILDSDRKVDLFKSKLSPIDVKVTNRSKQSQTVRIFAVFPFSVGKLSSIPPYCLVGPGGCTQRFDIHAFVPVGAGQSRIVRLLPRPDAANQYLGPSEARQRLQVDASVLVDVQLDTQIFRSVDRDSIAVTLNCPQWVNNGACRSL